MEHNDPKLTAFLNSPAGKEAQENAAKMFADMPTVEHDPMLAAARRVIREERAGVSSSDAERIAALEQQLADALAALEKLLDWRDRVTAEVASNPDLPCVADEFDVSDVPALLAVIAGRINDIEDYQPAPAP